MLHDIDFDTVFWKCLGWGGELVETACRIYRLGHNFFMRSAESRFGHLDECLIVTPRHEFPLDDTELAIRTPLDANEFLLLNKSYVLPATNAALLSKYGSILC